MASSVAVPERKRDCLERLLKINPNNGRARKALAKVEARMESAASNSSAPANPTPSPAPAAPPGATPTPVPLICPWCKSELPQGALACRYCGKDLPDSPAYKAETRQLLGSTLAHFGCLLFFIALAIPVLILVIGALTTK